MAAQFGLIVTKKCGLSSFAGYYFNFGISNETHSIFIHFLDSERNTAEYLLKQKTV